MPSGIKFEASDSSPVLQSALDANVNIVYGCRDGKCGAYKARLVSGEVMVQSERTIVRTVNYA